MNDRSSDDTVPLPDSPLEHAAAPEDASRRHFIQASLLGAGALGALAAPSLAHAQTSALRRTFNHYHIPASDKTVHWGYFSKSLKPLIEMDSGDFVTIETVTHHANDDRERMVEGDPGVESIFYWDAKRKGVDRRGAGPLDGCPAAPRSLVGIRTRPSRRPC